MSLFSWSVWPANRFFSTSKTKQNKTQLRSVLSLNGSDGFHRPRGREPPRVWWGKLPGNAAGSTTLTPSDQSDAALWLYFTTAFFNKAIKEQDVPFDTPPAQPVCAVGGHSCVTNRRESWLKRGVIWRLVTESDWALADKDNDSLRAKHCDVFFCFFFIPRNFQCLPSICLTPGKVETPGSWAQLYRTGSCDISVNISVSCSFKLERVLRKNFLPRADVFLKAQPSWIALAS